MPRAVSSKNGRRAHSRTRNKRKKRLQEGGAPTVMALPNTRPDQTLTFNAPARFIRIRPPTTSKADGNINISQVIIKNSAGTNIGLNKPVYATSIYARGKLPQLLVDGTITTPPAYADYAAFSFKIASAAANLNEYIEIDLGSVQQVASVQILGLSSGSSASGYTYFTRNIGTRVEIDTEPLTTTNEIIVANYTIPDNATSAVIPIPVKGYAKYIRIRPSARGGLTGVDGKIAVSQVAAFTKPLSGATPGASDVNIAARMGVNTNFTPANYTAQGWGRSAPVSIITNGDLAANNFKGDGTTGTFESNDGINLDAPDTWNDYKIDIKLNPNRDGTLQQVDNIMFYGRSDYKARTPGIRIELVAFNDEFYATQAAGARAGASAAQASSAQASAAQASSAQASAAQASSAQASAAQASAAQASPAQQAIPITATNAFMEVMPGINISAPADTPTPGKLAIAVDSLGRIFYADQLGRTVYMRQPNTPTSIVIAGSNGVTGYVDGLGSVARFNGPQYITIDRRNNDIYITEPGTHRIRKIVYTGTGSAFTAENWTVSTVAGTGAEGAVDGYGTAAAQTAASQPSTTSLAVFRYPGGLAVDTRNNLLVIAESGNQRVRIMNLTTGMVTSITGFTAHSPVDVAVDPLGNIYFNDFIWCNVHMLRRLGPGAYIDMIIAGIGSPAAPAGYTDGDARTTAKFNNIEGGIIVGPDGKIYVGDTRNNAIRVIGPGQATRTVSTLVGGTWAQTYPAVGANISLRPKSIAMAPDGSLYVNTYEGIAQIRGLPDSEIAAMNAKFPPVPKTMITTIAGTPNQSAYPSDGPARTTRFALPGDIAIDKRNGDIYVADRGNSCIRKMYLNTDGTYSIMTVAGSRVATSGSADGFREKVRMNGPSYLLLVGDTLYFSEVWAFGGWSIFIRKMDIKTGEVKSLCPLNFGGNTTIMALGSDGNIYFVERATHTVNMVTPAGVRTTIAGANGQIGYVNGPGPTARFNHPTGIAFDKNGIMYVTDTENRCIRKLTPPVAPSTQWTVSLFAGQPGVSGSVHGNISTTALFASPSYITILSNGNMMVIDSNTERRMGVIRMIVMREDGTGVSVPYFGYLDNWWDTPYRDGDQYFARFVGPASIKEGFEENSFLVPDLNAHTIRLIKPGTTATAASAAVQTQNTLQALVPAAQASLAAWNNMLSTQEVAVTQVTESGAIQITSNTKMPYLKHIAGNSAYGRTPAGEPNWRIGGLFRLGKGREASFNAFGNVVQDPSGNYYTVQNAANMIVKIGLDGTVSRFAGNGAQGYLDGPAERATITPLNIVYHPQTNFFYVPDVFTSNSLRIRKVALNGTVSSMQCTLVGTTKRPQLGGFVMDTAGNMYFTDGTYHVVWRISQDGKISIIAGQFGIPGTAGGRGNVATFNGLAGIAVNRAGTIVYVSEFITNSFRIIRYTPPSDASAPSGAGDPSSAQNWVVSTIATLPPGAGTYNVFLDRTDNPCAVVRIPVPPTNQQNMWYLVRFTPKAPPAADYNMNILFPIANDVAGMEVSEEGVVTANPSTMKAKMADVRMAMFDRDYNLMIGAEGNLQIFKVILPPIKTVEEESGARASAAQASSAFASSAQASRAEASAAQASSAQASRAEASAAQASSAQASAAQASAARASSAQASAAQASAAQASAAQASQAQASSAVASSAQSNTLSTMLTSLRRLNTQFLSPGTISKMNIWIQSVTGMQNTLASGALIPPDSLSGLQRYINDFIIRAQAEMQTASSAQASSAQASAAQASSAQASSAQASAAQASAAQASSAQASRAQASSAQASSAQASAAQASAAQASSAQASRAQASSAQASSAQASAAQASSAQASSAQASAAQASAAQASSAQASAAQASAAQGYSAIISSLLSSLRNLNVQYLTQDLITRRNRFIETLTSMQTPGMSGGGAGAGGPPPVPPPVPVSRPDLSTLRVEVPAFIDEANRLTQQTSSAQASSAQASSAQASRAQASSAQASSAQASAAQASAAQAFQASSAQASRAQASSAQASSAQASSAQASSAQASSAQAQASQAQASAAQASSAQASRAQASSAQASQAQASSAQASAAQASAAQAFQASSAQASRAQASSAQASQAQASSAQASSAQASAAQASAAQAFQASSAQASRAQASSAQASSAQASAAQASSAQAQASQAQASSAQASAAQASAAQASSAQAQASQAQASSAQASRAQASSAQASSAQASQAQASRAQASSAQASSAQASQAQASSAQASAAQRALTESNTLTTMLTSLRGLNTQYLSQTTRTTLNNLIQSVYNIQTILVSGALVGVDQISTLQTSVNNFIAMAQRENQSASSAQASSAQASAAQASAAQASAAQASAAQASAAQAFQASSAQASSAQASAAQASAAQASRAQASSAQASAAQASSAQASSAQAFQASAAQASAAQASSAQASSAQASRAQASSAQASSAQASSAQASAAQASSAQASAAQASSAQASSAQASSAQAFQASSAQASSAQASAAQASAAQASSAQASRAQASSAQASSAQAFQASAAQASAAQASSAQASSAQASAAQASSAQASSAQASSAQASSAQASSAQAFQASSAQASRAQASSAQASSAQASSAQASAAQASAAQASAAQASAAQASAAQASAAQASAAQASAAQASRAQASSAQASAAQGLSSQSNTLSNLLISLRSLNTIYLPQSTIATQNNHIQSVTAMQTTLASGALIPSDQLTTLENTIQGFLITAHGEIHTASSALASGAAASAAQASSAQAFQASSARASSAQASSAQASAAQASAAQASAAQASAAQAFQASAAQASAAQAFQASSAQASAAQASGAAASAAQASAAQASAAQASAAQASAAQASGAAASAAQASSAQASAAQASAAQASGAAASAAQASRAQASSAQASAAQASSAQAFQASSAQASQAQTVHGFVSTFAGRPEVIGYNNGTITDATFTFPACIAIDSKGNMFISDQGNNCIRKITPQGVVTTFVGSGNAAFADGRGTEASFSGPDGLAIDANDNMYIADLRNNRIRKVTPDGVVTTLAGSGNAAFANGIGAGASFNRPRGVAVDAKGNVFVADTGNNRIRMIAPGGAVITFAGSGNATHADGNGTEASFKLPVGVAVDTQGNVIVADTDNNCIRMITASGVVTTLAGDMTFVRPTVQKGGGTFFADGFANEALFDRPMGISVDAANNIYVADSNNMRIRKITERNVTTIAGNGAYSFADGMGPSASFRRVRHVAVDKNGDLYVTDSENHVIRRITKMATSVAEASAAQASQAQVSAAQASMASGPKASAAQASAAQASAAAASAAEASSAQASSAQASRAQASSAQAFQASSAQASSAQASSAQASSAQASQAQANQASSAQVATAQATTLSSLLTSLESLDARYLSEKFRDVRAQYIQMIKEMQATLASGELLTTFYGQPIQMILNTITKFIDDSRRSIQTASSAQVFQASAAQASQAQASAAQASGAAASAAQASSAQASAAQASSALASAAEASGAAVTQAQIQRLTEHLKSLNDLNTQYLSGEYMTTLDIYKKTLTSWIATLTSGGRVPPNNLATFETYMEDFLYGANDLNQTASAAQVSGARASAAQAAFQASAAQAFEASAAQASAAQAQLEASAAQAQAQLQASAAQAQLQASAAQAQLQASAAQAQPRPVPTGPTERQYGEDSEVVLGEEIDTTVPRAETQYGEAENIQEEEEAEEEQPQEGGRIKRRRRTRRKSIRRKRANKISSKNKKRNENKKGAK